MNYLTLQFWPLFFLFIGVYYFLPAKFQNLFLGAANLTVMALWGKESFIILVISLLVSYGAYLKVASPFLDRSQKKKWLSGYILFQISLLIFYKAFARTFPIGLSYYSLTIIAYLLEVFWKRTDLRVTFIEYLVSVSFFPVIMIGPIERLTRFTPQLREKRSWTQDHFKSGFYYVALGLFKIAAVSNPLSPLLNYSESAAHEVYGFGLVLYCLLAFFKLYTEFSGFIDVVTGMAFFLGLRISRNFDQPYLALNVNDVWKRWHISLTSWLRDFVFLPLVLKTKNVIFSSVVLFLLVGAWHGLRIDFFYWSLYWIFFYLIHYAFQKGVFKLKIPEYVKIAVTLMITSLSTLCFMIPGSGALPLLQRLVHLNAGSFSSLQGPLQQLHVNLSFVMAAILLMVGFESYKEKKFLILKTIILFFLIAFLGEMTMGSLLYLRI